MLRTLGFRPRVGWALREKGPDKIGGGYRLRISPVVIRVFSRRFKLKHETVRSSRRWIYGKKSVDGVKVVLAKDGKFCGRPQLGQTLWLEKNCAAVVVCNILESVHCRLFSTSSHTTKISSQPCARTSAGTRLSAVEAAAKRGMHGGATQ